MKYQPCECGSRIFDQVVLSGERRFRVLKDGTTKVTRNYYWETATPICVKCGRRGEPTEDWKG